MKVHLSDIARKAGVSKMTVSRALRQDPAVAPFTRDKILRVAKELGYVPNPKLTRLMHELARSRNDRNILGELAYITTDKTDFFWRDFYHQHDCYEGAKAEALAYGYNLLHIWALSRRYTGDQLTNFLWSRGVDGIIVAPLGKEMIGKPLRIDWGKFCCVQIGATMSEPKLNLVRHNHYRGMAHSLEELENLGYRKIGLCSSSISDMRSYHRWSSAYLHWRAVRGFSSETLPSFFYNSGDVDRRAFGQWVSRYGIEAVIAMDSEIMEVCAKIRLRIPDDIGFCVLDNPGRGSGIAGIDQIAQQIGGRAVDELVVSVRKNARGIPANPIQTIVDGIWRQGKTVLKIGSPITGRITAELENMKGSF